MSKPKSEARIIFEAEGLLDAEDLIIENEDRGSIDLDKILKSVDSKFVKISVVATEALSIPVIED